MKRLLSLLHCRYLHLGIAAIVSFCVATSCLEILEVIIRGIPEYPGEPAPPENWNLPISESTLNYDVRPFLEEYKRGNNNQAPTDWNELVSAHNITDHTNCSLTIKDVLPSNLHDVWSHWNSHPDDGPKVSFSFSSKYSEKTDKRTYTEYEESLCRDNVVRAVPYYDCEYICDFHAQTITTSKSRISINWEHTIILHNEEALWIKYGDTDGIVGAADPFVKSTTGDDEVAVRETTGGERVVVENTVPSNLHGKTVSFRIVSTKPVITDVLSQPVLKGGRVSTYKWKEPRLAKIQSK